MLVAPNPNTALRVTEDSERLVPTFITVRSFLHRRANPLQFGKPATVWVALLSWTFNMWPGEGQYSVKCVYVYNYCRGLFRRTTFRGAYWARAGVSEWFVGRSAYTTTFRVDAGD
jgi:hypothetical protein